MNSQDLSVIENELWELIRCGAMKLKDIQALNPRYVGALGKLKQKGFVVICRLPQEKLVKPVIDAMEEE